MLELELLGPLRLRRDGAPQPLTVKKSQALLVLLASVGALPRSRAVALLWPQLDESTGRRNLRRELARLRDGGLADIVLAEGDQLCLAPVLQCDLHRFDAALAGGQPDAALALWRGVLAAGLTLDDAPEFDHWMAAERERLQRSRQQALGASAALLEARGDAAGALRQIETLLADDPLQERHQRDAMRLLAACGRREAALAQYERCRALLRDELGLATMAETDALAASLRGSTLAAAPPPTPATTTLLPDSLPFVGRATEIALLEAAWQAGQAVLIEAEGGVGKTRLALDFLAAHGACALARCRPGDAEVPYAAFTRALRALAGPTPVPAELPPWVVDELARLLPELGRLPPPLRSDEERGRFFEACAQGWLALAADNFDAVVLDDWHHADAASRTLLAFIAQRRRDAAPATAREWLLLRPELDATATQRLATGLQALHLRLLPLDAAAGYDLLRRLSGASRPARFAARLQRATGGNPYFLIETLRHLAEMHLLAAGADGVWRTPFDDATEDYRELPVPATVRDAVLARVRRLPVAGQRVLEAAALASEPFAPALLAPACALSEVETVLAIEQAVDAQLLREHDGGGFAFVHDLVQQALDAALPAERRRLVHRRLALGAEAAGAPPATIAAHHEASGDRQRAAAYRLAAGEQALHLHLLPQAVQHWLQGLADDPAPVQRAQLLQHLMRVERWLHQVDASLLHAQDLHVLLTGDTLAPAERVDGQIALASYLAQNMRVGDALALLDGLESTLSDKQHGLAMVARVHALRESGQGDAATTAARSALALTALQGRDRADLLDALVVVDWRANRLPQALAGVEASMAICSQLGDDFGAARGCYRRGMILTEQDDLAAAEAEFLRGLAHSDRLGTTSNQAAMLYGLVGVYQAMDRPVDVVGTARRALDLLPGRSSDLLSLMLRLAQLRAHTSLGQLGAAWALAESAVQELLALEAGLQVEAMAALDLSLFVCLGATCLLDPLHAATMPLARDDPSAEAGQWWLAQAEMALMTGRPAAARVALDLASDLPESRHDRARLRLALARSQLALAESSPAVALAGLPASLAPGIDSELRARIWTLRLAAEAAPWAPASIAAAREALAAPDVPRLVALALQRTLATAIASEETARRRLVEQLAASLEGSPERQSAFRRWAV